MALNFQIKFMTHTVFNRLFLFIAFIAILLMNPQNTLAQKQTTSEEPESPRKRLLMDFKWRFHRGDVPIASDWQGVKNYDSGPPAVDFNDLQWRLLDVPHDFVAEGQFTKTASKNNGFLPKDIAWYRKAFLIPESDLGRRIYVEFDGVFRDSTVYLNGFYVGGNLSGYTSFRFDITDFINYGGKNVLSVRVDSTGHEGWWYEGGGIYRHVWMVKTGPLHVAPWGVFVSSKVREKGGKNNASVQIQTKVLNRYTEGKEFVLRSTILDPSGKKVAEADEDMTVESWGDGTAEQNIEISKPLLWSVERPNLYRLVTAVIGDGEVLDEIETNFGIRYTRFDPQKGFFLNGEPLKIKGVNCHQDHAGLGVALPDRVHEFRIQKLKEMGCNAYRCSHNPPAPELLDACDRLGMLVMDETRIMSSSRECLAQLESIVLRDRNHPSIIMWSLGNEEGAVQGNVLGQRIIRTMKQLVKKLDPTRPVTAAMNGGYYEPGVATVVDVLGFNYHPGDYDKYHKYRPDQPLISTEGAATTCTRGIYHRDREKGYCWAYDIQEPELLTWALDAESTWKAVAERPFICGTFIWAGIDYRGEPTPHGWPCINSHFGIMDTCGFPKDNYYYYKSWWSDQAVLHIFPHWNWPNRHGQTIDVWCHSNLEEIELFLNGGTLGKKTMQPNSHLEWKVPYEPGVLEAKGYRQGKLVATTSVETTGQPAVITLHPDRKKVNADREDVAVVTVQIEDSEGRLVPIADNEVAFSVSGPGRIIGVGNGNPSSHEPDKANRRRAFNGFCQVIVQSTDNPGTIIFKATSPGLKDDSIEIFAEPSKLRPYVPALKD